MATNHPSPTATAPPGPHPGDAPRPARDAVVVADLHRSYGPVRAVRGVSFTVRHGEIFALLGPNGAGKSTTLEILEGFRTRDAGRVEVLGLDPGDRATGRELRERTGLMLQDVAVEPYLTVRETVARDAGYYPAPRDVDEVLALVGLAGREKQRVRALSGGQKRRLDLALCLVGDPRLVFLDEPTTGFDPTARRAAWRLVRQLRDAGTTVVLTTHYMEEAQELADRVAVLAAGRIVAEGAPAELGGRAAALTRISFALPAGASLADLPPTTTREAAHEAAHETAHATAHEATPATPATPAATVAEDGRVTVRTDRPTETLHRLTAWALGRGATLDRLTVDRPSLEDVYLSLTDGATGTERSDR